MIDAHKTTTQKLYSDTVDLINDNSKGVPGKTLADKVETLRVYWVKNKDKATVQRMIDDLTNLILENKEDAGGVK